MQRLDRRGMVERVVEVLRGWEVEGREVPTCRELSADLEVSVPTALGAMRVLAEEGRLISGSGRRRARWSAAGVKVVETPRILVVCPRWLGNLSMVMRTELDRLHMEANARGWGFHREFWDYGPGQKHAVKRWNEVAERVRPSHVIAVLGSPVLAAWAKRCDLPTLFLGGSPGEHQVPTLGVSLSASVRQILPHLLAAGHSHPCLPLCGYGEDHVVAIRRVFSEVFADAGLSFVPNYHVPVAEGAGMESILGLLRPVLKARLPTAMLFTDSRHYLASLNTLRKAGLFPGENLAAGILGHDVEIEWMDPQPAHFRYPLSRFRRLMLDWLLAPHAPRFQKGLILLPAGFVAGCGIG